MRIDLQIGGYAIRLDEAEGHACPAWPFSTFEPFVRNHMAPDSKKGDRHHSEMEPVPAPDIAMTVRVVQRLPEIPHGPLLYDACHGLWKWHEADAGYLLESPDRSTREPEALALVSADIASAVVWVLAQPATETTQMRWEPLHVINPIVEACLLTRLARDGGLLLHAAGLLTAQGGLAFTGASGAGKSTISDFYAARGARVLSDERVILRMVEGAMQVFGTPWPGTGRHARNQHAPLTGLFCIRHGKNGHALRRMPANTAASFILQQCFLPHWDRLALDNTLAFLGTLIERIPCYELAFVKSPDVVDYLDEQNLERPLVPS